MTYIENIFLCMVSPLLLAALCMGRRQLRFFVFCIAGMGVCLLSAYINTFFAAVYQADALAATAEIAPVVEEIMKLLPLAFYLLVFEPEGEKIKSAAVMVALVTAYGPDAFGPDKSFVAAQASVVATMVSGIPSVPWFVGGFIAGIVMYWLGIPAMMIGLGVYLPFYMSLTAFLGSCVKLAYDKWSAHRDATAGLSDEERAAKDAAFQEQGLVVASGLLGGESIVGVILAFVSVGLSLLG